MYEQIRYTSMRQIPVWLAETLGRVSKVTISLLYLSALLVWRTAHAIMGRPPSPRPPVILTYHNVKAHERRIFERQMRCIRQTTEAVFADFCDVKRPVGARVAVTFDDGFRNVIDNVLPITQAQGIPVTIFIVSGYIGTKPGWIKDPNNVNADEVLLSQAEIQALASRRDWLIEAHTLTHQKLPGLDRQAVWREVAQSKAQLEALIGKPVTMLSFPYGAWNASVAEVCRETGYGVVFANLPRWGSRGTDSFVRGRVLTSAQDWWLEFRLKLCGAYQWYPAGVWLKRRLLALLGRRPAGKPAPGGARIG